MTDRESDLSQVIYGILDPEDPTATIMEGERTPFALFLGGGLAVRTTIEIDEVSLHELGTHLEQFSGVDKTDQSKSSGIAPGKQVRGVRNMSLGIVWLTEVDGQAVAQESGFYNLDDDRER